MLHEHSFNAQTETVEFALIGSRAVRGLLNNCSQMHLWRLTNDARYGHLNFPRPVKINGRNYFRISAIRRWVAERESSDRARQLAQPLNREVKANAKQSVGGGHDR